MKLGLPQSEALYDWGSMTIEYCGLIQPNQPLQGTAPRSHRWRHRAHVPGCLPRSADMSVATTECPRLPSSCAVAIPMLPAAPVIKTLSAFDIRKFLAFHS